MAPLDVNFFEYEARQFKVCLKLFDENCPHYFAENERKDYAYFLKSPPGQYFVGMLGAEPASAFGLIFAADSRRARLTWILVSAKSRGIGVGIKMMNQARQICSERGITAIDIAASHLSAPFFQKFGTSKIIEIPNGWGPGMHRIDMELKLTG